MQHHNPKKKQPNITLKIQINVTETYIINNYQNSNLTQTHTLMTKITTTKNTLKQIGNMHRVPSVNVKTHSFKSF